MTLLERAVAITITATLAVLTAPDVINIANTAVDELNRIGAGERARQEQVHQVACEAFPADCGAPVPPWVDAFQIEVAP